MLSKTLSREFLITQVALDDDVRALSLEVFSQLHTRVERQLAIAAIAHSDARLHVLL